MRLRRNCKCETPGHSTPFYPVAIQNGYLTSKPDRAAPQTDVDHAPREFRRYVDASGFSHVQANNGLWSRRGSGLMGPIAYVDFLAQSVPTIPGQNRDNYGGFHKARGIDPQSYQQLWNNGPGAQPVNPGGPGKIAADYFINPGTC
jgi:hypothetical protein